MRDANKFVMGVKIKAAGKLQIRQKTMQIWNTENYIPA